MKERDWSLVSLHSACPCVQYQWTTVNTMMTCVCECVCIDAIGQVKYALLRYL